MPDLVLHIIPAGGNPDLLLNGTFRREGQPDSMDNLLDIGYLDVPDRDPDRPPDNEAESRGIYPKTQRI